MKKEDIDVVRLYEAVKHLIDALHESGVDLGASADLELNHAAMALRDADLREA